MRNFNDFIQSEAGMLARYRQRQSRRINIYIDDIEPQSKKMPSADRDKFQAAIAEQLTLDRRGPFTGDVALKLHLATTGKNPPQAHTIAKNILDLLSERRPGVKWRRRHLLYKDDRQIQALSVSCRHGEDQPTIGLEARPFTAMLDDLELATEAIRADEMSGDNWYREDQEAEWVSTFRDLKRNELERRQRLGDDFYEAYLKMVRWSAQRALLSRSGVNIPVLSWMYQSKGISTGLGKEMWAQLIRDSKLRLHVGELPIATGGSKVFEQTVAAAIDEFKRRWDWIIDPLVIAVGLEVIVRPNPATPPSVLHDLDNIVRDYLLPSIVPSFGTVSDHRWTIDFEELRRRDPELAARWGPNPTPPSGTKKGVTRYEAWRLPPVAGEPGFVSVALVADMDANGDLMRQIDESIRKWSDKRSSQSRLRRWRA